MVSLEEIRAIIGNILQIPDRLDALEVDAPLLGGIPELDSMAVVSILTTIEECYGIVIDDDEIGAEQFRTIGNLFEFVDSKVG